MIELKTLVEFDYINKLASDIIGAAIAVHRTIGAGHHKETYLTCWVYELREKGLNVEIYSPVPLKYKNMVLEQAMLLEIVVEDCIVLEPMTVTQGINDDHVVSMLNKLRFTEIPLGILINFNVKFVRGEAIRRVAN